MNFGFELLAAEPSTCYLSGLGDNRSGFHYKLSTADCRGLLTERRAGTAISAGANTMDFIDSEFRSRLMGRIRGKDTKPEMVVRRIAHRLGFRFRLHRRDLPGSPDLVFPASRKVVFVHGCYWHRHPGCRLAYLPKSNIEFWTDKFAANVARDEKAIAALREQDWEPLVIWECETKDSILLVSRLSAHLKKI